MMRMDDVPQAAMRHLWERDEEAQRRFLSEMEPADLLRLDAMFETWAQRAQLPPEGPHWRTWLMLAGRGFGKTRAGAEWIHRLAMSAPNRRIALVGATIDEARTIMVEGRSGLLFVASRFGVDVRWEASAGRLRWPNGSQATLFSGDSPDGLRGPEHHFAWEFTFEVCADDGDVEVGEILFDASGGVVVASRADRSVSGFAAYGKSQADAIQDLVELFDVQLSERGGILVDAGSVAVARQPIADELGCSADEQAAPILRRVQHSHEIPSRMTVSYYEPTRDYQSGLAEAIGGINGGGERKVELAAAIGAEQARALANNVLVRAGEEAVRVSVCLPPTEMDIQVGETVVLPNGNAFAVRAVTIDSMVSRVELGRSSTLVDAVPADAGTSVGTPDLPIGRTSLALVEVPANAPDGGLRLVASNAGAWRPVTAELLATGSTIGAVRVGIRGTVGTVERPLDAGASDTIDGVNELVVALANPAQSLFNADIDGLLGGANLAMIGDELIQFASAEPLGNGRWRLRTMLRGLWGSEWASSSHVVGEPFCLVDRAGVDLAAMTNAAGTLVRVEAHGVSDAAPLPSAERTITREGERPMAPCRLCGTADTETVTFDWTARDRTLWGWGDAIDPVNPRFLVTIAGASAEIVRDVVGCSLSLARAELAGIGEGTLTVRVEAVGAGLRSRALVRTLTL